MIFIGIKLCLRLYLSVICVKIHLNVDGKSNEENARPKARIGSHLHRINSMRIDATDVTLANDHKRRSLAASVLEIFTLELSLFTSGVDI